MGPFEPAGALTGQGGYQVLAQSRPLAFLTR